MKINIVRIMVSIDMTNGEMLKIIDKDKISKISLDSQLKKIDEVNKVEYDGMFGPHIWITIDLPPGNKADLIAKKALKIIQKYIN